MQTSLEARSYEPLSLSRALLAGLAGTLLLTTAHQLLRGRAGAPRMDRIGRRAMAKTRRALGAGVPRRDALQRQTLAGELVANSLYYGLLAGRARHPWRRGLAAGLAAGVGGAWLPPRMGLADRRHQRSETQAATVALYTLGGLGTAAAAAMLSRRGDADSARP